MIKYEQILEMKNDVKKRQLEYEIKLREYRAESVCRVLDFVRTKNKLDNDLDTLLCHCQNKLHGNIDGIELTLEKE